MSDRKLAVVGVPTAAGGRGPGVADAPRALRQAGLLQALREVAPNVTDLADLSAFPFQQDDANPRRRNAAGVAAAVSAVAEEMTRVLAEGFPLLLGGDCTLVAGTLAGIRRTLREPVGLVFLDADADLNTPETTPSGYLHGMALALAMGRGAPEVVSAAGGAGVAGDHVSLVGFRALDPGEKGPLGDLGLALPARAASRIGMRTTAALALDGVGNADGPLLVHLDVDVIDPAEMPAKTVLVGGEALSYAEVSDLVTALAASPRVVALELCELDTSKDPDGRHARRIVELLARAVGRRFRS